MNYSRYHADGYDCFKGCMSLSHIASARDWLHANRTRQDVQQTRDLTNRDQKLPIKVRRLWSVDPEFWASFVRESGVLNLVKSVLGDQFLLIRSAAFIKYSQTSAFVGWHRDEDLWGHPCESGLTAWIPLTDAREANGCLEFVKGSHKRPGGKLYWDLRHPYHKVMDVTDLGPVEKVEALVGDCIVMDKAAVHASGPNVSGDERIGLVLAFAVCDHDLLTESAIDLSDGKFGEVLPVSRHDDD